MTFFSKAQAPGGSFIVLPTQPTRRAALPPQLPTQQFSRSK
jgi:hypothetical protein